MFTINCLCVNKCVRKAESIHNSRCEEYTIHTGIASEDEEGDSHTLLRLCTGESVPRNFSRTAEVTISSDGVGISGKEKKKITFQSQFASQ